MDDPRFYNELPFRDASGRFNADWRIRARSFVALEKRLIAPLEKKMNKPLHILDLGAGNGWLSNRLAQRGHQVAAVDLLTNRYDGLGAWIHYQTRFPPIQAEFERLPLPDSYLDLVIFNASLHYARDYSIVLKEALRVLSPQGRFVVLDTPVYRDPDSGRRMVHEREEYYVRKYGFPSNALSSQNFLTYQQLDWLAYSLGVKWEIHKPYYGPSWAVRQLRARLLGKREPAKFLLIEGRRAEAVHIAKSLLVGYEHDL
jgi:SAM-dependent methyltransferase